MKISNEQIGFNKNHAIIIGAVILALSFYSLPRMGINVKAMFDKNEVKVAVPTYDETRSKVIADMGLTENPDYNKAREQIALLNRGAIDANVLGEAIGVGAIPGANEMDLPEMEQLYPLNVIKDNGVETVANYHRYVNQIEAKYGVIGMLTILNSSDTQMIMNSMKQWKSMLQELSKIPVPSSLENMHHARLGYYYSMMKTGEVYAGMTSESELGLYVKAMLAFSNKMGEDTQ